MQFKPAPASCYRKPRVDETNCPTAKERLRLLGKIEALVNEDRIPLSAALKAVELRRSTYYDWRKALNERGVRGLGSQEPSAALFLAALDEARRAPRAGRPRRPPAVRQAAHPPRTQAPEERLRRQRLDGGAHPLEPLRRRPHR